MALAVAIAASFVSLLSFTGSALAILGAMARGAWAAAFTGPARGSNGTACITTRFASAFTGAAAIFCGATVIGAGIGAGAVVATRAVGAAMGATNGAAATARGAATGATPDVEPGAGLVTA